MTVLENLLLGSTHRAARAHRAERPRSRVRAVSGPARAAHRSLRAPSRGGTADARDRPRIDDAAEAADARRALARLGAQDRHRDPQGHRRTQPRRPDRPADRTERQALACRSRITVSCSRTGGSCWPIPAMLCSGTNIRAAPIWGFEIHDDRCRTSWPTNESSPATHGSSACVPRRRSMPANASEPDPARCAADDLGEDERTDARRHDRCRALRGSCAHAAGSDRQGARAGEIEFDAAQDNGAMAGGVGSITASTPVMVIEDRSNGTSIDAFSHGRTGPDAGLGRLRRFGSRSPSLVSRRFRAGCSIKPFGRSAASICGRSWSKRSPEATSCTTETARQTRYS